MMHYKILVDGRLKIIADDADQREIGDLLDQHGDDHILLKVAERLGFQVFWSQGTDDPPYIALTDDVDYNEDSEPIVIEGAPTWYYPQYATSSPWTYLVDYGYVRFERGQ